MPWASYKHKDGYSLENKVPLTKILASQHILVPNQ